MKEASTTGYIVNKKILKNLAISASIAAFATSCATSSTDGSAANGLQKAAGDAAVDSATKNVDPLTGAAIRNSGYGTDPSTELLNKAGIQSGL